MQPVSRRDVQMAGNRANQYRRQRAIEQGAPTGNLAEKIVTILGAFPPPPASKPGWYRIGTVFDGVIEQELAIDWHRETGRVRVESPTDDSMLPDLPSYEQPALVYRIYGPRHYVADQRYRYFLDGQEYTAQEAESTAAERKSVVGWTWEKVPDG
jgi:hypothetical protein